MYTHELHVKDEEAWIVSSSSKGDQLKWKSGNLWIKADKFGYESLAEWAVSELIARSNIPSELQVKYETCQIVTSAKTFIGCFSTDFLGNTGYELITLHRLFEMYGQTFEGLTRNKSTTMAAIDVSDFVERITGLPFLDYLGTMLKLDSFILNEDRHLNNIAVLFNGESYKLCPYFDHGLSLLSDIKAYPETLSLTIATRKVKAKPFTSNFSRQYDALESNLSFDKVAVLDFIEDNKENLGRVSHLLLSQIKKYPNMFI